MCPIIKTKTYFDSWIYYENYVLVSYELLVILYMYMMQKLLDIICMVHVCILLYPRHSKLHKYMNIMSL